MKKILLLLVTVITMTACSDEDNDLTQDKSKKEPTEKEPTKGENPEDDTPKVNVKKYDGRNLIGVANRESFTSDDDHKGWLNSGYSSYTPNANVINEIKDNIEGITIKAFMGTWCPMSTKEVPRLYKILDDANFEEKKLTMICVNNQKEANGLETELKEEGNKVATFIFYKNGEKIGSFVEITSNGKTLEQEILDILKK